VVVHVPCYPTSVLFEEYEEAEAYYLNIKSECENNPVITLTKIIRIKGENKYSHRLEWYVGNIE
jgi:hypothetical protein